jgi:hypothetical protein
MAKIVETHRRKAGALQQSSHRVILSARTHFRQFLPNVDVLAGDVAVKKAHP